MWNEDFVSSNPFVLTEKNGNKLLFSAIQIKNKYWSSTNEFETKSVSNAFSSSSHAISTLILSCKSIFSSKSLNDSRLSSSIECLRRSDFWKKSGVVYADVTVDKRVIQGTGKSADKKVYSKETRRSQQDLMQQESWLTLSGAQRVAWRLVSNGGSKRERE